MSYHLEIDKRDDYLYINFFGSWTKANGKQILNDIFTSVAESGCKKAFLDFRQSEFMEASTLMDYDEATTVAAFSDIKQYKFASVFRPEEVNRFLFWETVAVNRGIRIKFFQQEMDALNWLKE